MVYYFIYGILLGFLVFCKGVKDLNFDGKNVERFEGNGV